MWDVVVVGAGPVGGYAARELQTRGLRVLMLEEHSEIGKPFQCAGLVNPGAMRKVKLEETILTNVFGARIHSPAGIMLPVGTDGKVRTHVVCRKLFDEGVVRQAIDVGADLWLDSKPKSITVNDEGVEIVIDKYGEEISVNCSLIIGADGAHSWTRRYFKLGHPKEWMVGFQTEVTGYSGKDCWLDMYTGKEVAPGFFAWVIPNGETHRIGVWGRAKDFDGKSLEEFYDALLQHPLWSDRFSACRETARFCGPIPAGMLRKPFSDRVLLVGDAAGLAKPTTGGGIGPGFEQIDLIADKLVKNIISNNLSEKQISKICKPVERLRKEQKKSRTLRNFFVTERTDIELEHNFKVWSKPEVLKLINTKGEIERPVALGLALVKQVPEFRKMALKAGFALLRAR